MPEATVDMILQNKAAIASAVNAGMESVNALVLKMVPC